MINLNVDIKNPWSDRWDILWNKTGRLTKNKAWEFNGYRTNSIVDLDFGLSFTGDHAGIRFMLGLFGYSIEFHEYDIRHWNYELNQWVSYE